MAPNRAGRHDQHQRNAPTGLTFVEETVGNSPLWLLVVPDQSNRPTEAECVGKMHGVSVSTEQSDHPDDRLRKDRARHKQVIFRDHERWNRHADD